jgi:predicted RNA methylase
VPGSRRPPRQDPSRQGGGDKGAPAWLLRCAPGLAKLLITELRFNGLIDRRTRPTILWQRNHDLVFLPRLRLEPRETDLRIAEEIHRCPVYGRYKISHHQLDVIAGTLRAGRGAHRLVVTVDGARFNRHEQARWLGRELGQRGIALDETSQRLACLFCVEDAYYFCLPYRDADRTALRGHRVAEREGSLPPTIAAAMAFAGNPQDNDTILDPVCGSGTLLAEAHAFAPKAQLLGIDSDRQAMAAARRNLAHVQRLELSVGDGRATGLPAASVTLFLANLPFGKQFGSRAENRQLYADLLREMLRLGRADQWRAVLLTADADTLRAAAAAQSLRVANETAVKVRGENAQMFILRPHPVDGDTS